MYSTPGLYSTCCIWVCLTHEVCQEVETAAQRWILKVFDLIYSPVLGRFFFSNRPSFSSNPSNSIHTYLTCDTSFLGFNPAVFSHPTPAERRSGAACFIKADPELHLTYICRDDDRSLVLVSFLLLTLFDRM